MGSAAGVDAVLLKGWHKAAVATVLLLAAGVLAHLHVAAQVYYPVVRMTSPDGLVMTALQDETDDRRRCGEANERFIAPMRAHCKDCKVAYARCARELDRMGATLFNGSPAPHFVMLSPGLRVAMEGPQHLARETCEFVAGDLVRRGYRTAVCIAPIEKRAGK
jgi:hypothetical protein